MVYKYFIFDEIKYSIHVSPRQKICFDPVTVITEIMSFDGN